MNNFLINTKKPMIGIVSNNLSSAAPIKEKSILDLLYKIDKDCLVERKNGIKIYTYESVKIVNDYLESMDCKVIYTAMPFINEEYGCCVFTYQLSNETTMHPFSFYYKY